VHPSEDDPGKFFVAGQEGGVGYSVGGEVGVVGHEERDSHDTCVEDGGENHESWTRNMNQIRLQFFQNLRAFHLWQINRKTYMIIQRKCKALRMMNLKPKLLFRQLFLRSVCIHRQNTDFVSRFLQVPQHFVKSIGITGYVGEWRWFDHEAYFAGREAAEWRRIVVVFIAVGEGGGGLGGCRIYGGFIVLVARGWEEGGGKGCVGLGLGESGGQPNECD